MTNTLKVHSYGAAVLYRNKILLLGGASDADLDFPTDVVEEYCPATNQWTLCDWKLPVTLMWHFAFFMQVFSK